MAEETFHPQPPPPNAPKYYHPGWYYYSPEPFETTYIPKHHHRHVPAPLKHAVHELTHPFGDGYPLPAPRCDVRESRAAYHVDVELPGVRDREDVRLRWTGARSLFVDACVRPVPVPGEEEKDSDENNKKNEEKDKPVVHFLKRERKTGEFARGFNFPVDVEQDKTVAKLAHGVLTITVPKKTKDEEEQHKHVEIEHAGH